MGLNQTSFGAFLDASQPTLSQWETFRREEPLPPELATKFLELWDCFASRPPPRDFDDALSLLATYRTELTAAGTSSFGVASGQRGAKKAGHFLFPLVLARGKPLPAGTKLVEMVPVDSSTTTRLFSAVPSETEPSRDAGMRPGGTGTGVPVGQGPAPRRRGAGVRLLLAVSGLVLFLPLGCLWVARPVTTEPQNHPQPEEIECHATDVAHITSMMLLGVQQMTGSLLPNQKGPPCSRPEVEARNACWYLYAVEGAPIPERRKKSCAASNGYELEKGDCEKTGFVFHPAEVPVRRAANP